MASATVAEIDDYEFRVERAAGIVNRGSTTKYLIWLTPREEFKGTIHLTASGLPSALSYRFTLNNKDMGSSLTGLVPPALAKLEISAGSASEIGEHHFTVSAQNFWTGGSSEVRSRNLTLTVVARDEEGIHLEVEKADVRKGEGVAVYGAIVPPLVGESVELTLTYLDGGEPQTLDLTTMTNGLFEDRDLIPTLEIGYYKVRASWRDGNSDTHHSLSRYFTVDKGKVVLTCLRGGSEEPAIDEEFQIRGSIDPVVAGTPVTLRVVDPEGQSDDYTIYTDADGAYSRSQEFFNKADLSKKKGIWKFKVYWMGNADYTGTESDFLVVPVEVDTGRAIMLSGGEASQDNTYWAVTKSLAVKTYRDFKAKGFTDDMIHFMINSESIDINYDDVPDPIVDDTLPTAEGFLDAVENTFVNDLNADTPLFIYMQGHATDSYFNVLGDDQRLGAAQLGDALDRLQEEIGVDCKVVVIIEACYSGNFIAELSGPNRVILTSAGDEQYRTDHTGRIAFSRFLFAKLREGDTLMKAFDYAKNSLVNMGYPTPQLDDNDDQKSDAADGLLAAELYLTGSITWGLKPVVAEAGIPQILEGTTSAPVVVRVIKGDGEIERVWVKIIPPGADITGGDRTISYSEIDLVHNPTLDPSAYEKVYEGELAGLTRPGIYTIIVFAEDTEREVSNPSIAYTSVTSAALPGDANGDGTIGLADAVLALKAAVAVETGAEDINLDADVNGDNRIGIAEAVFAMQAVAGAR